MSSKSAVVGNSACAGSPVDGTASFRGALTGTIVKKAATGVILIALALGTQGVIAHADALPKLNVVPSCMAAASYAGLLGRDEAACVRDENDALDALKTNWSQYSSSDKSDCVGTVETGGPPSYVELLSWLEMMKDVAAIHKSEPPMTTTRSQHK